MRDFKGMKRQRGRNRGSGGGNSGGKPQQHNANRAFDSNGPEGVKVRGAAQSVFEKYQQLARDASSGGDRVLAENYLQHAEHYFRTLRAMQPHRPVSEIVGREQFSSGFDIDFEAEPGEAPETPDVEPSDNAEGSNGDGQRDNNRDGQRFEGRQQRDDRPRDRDRDGNQQQPRQRDRDDRPRNNNDRPRDDRPRDERPRDDRPRDERPRDERPRDDQQQQQQPREGGEATGGRRDRWRERDERRERQERAAAEAPRDPLAVIEPQAAPFVAEQPSEESPRLRGQDGAVSELPAFLGRPAQSEPREDVAAPEAAKKPRRRRAPRSFEGGEGAPTETEEA